MTGTLKTPYRPRQREIPADVLTPGGWMAGTFIVPQAQNLLDFLNTSGRFLKLTAVRRPGRTEQLPFFALSEESALLIVPQDRHRVVMELLPATVTPLQISCVLPAGLLEGRLEFLKNLRLSDFLRQHDGFLMLRDATWQPETGRLPSDGRRDVPTVMVNANRLTGIEESLSQPVEGHPRALPRT
ncbi:MAG TPA: hypothetical protein VLT17_10610 [Gemmatimonadales bacterium]|jgi:hypothetical protein|nr:hypothetical protein [Gemmatimonadales bacterium]